MNNKALIDAAKCDSVAKLNKAVKSGANINYKDLQTFTDEKGISHGRFNTSLHIAVFRNCPPLVTRLIELKADCNVMNEGGHMPLNFASAQGYIQICILLIQNGALLNTEYSPLFFACYNDHIKVCELLIENGADVNKAIEGGGTPLMVASKIGSLSICDLLIKSGAKVNQFQSNTYTKTALFFAVRYGNLNVCILLIKNGANVNHSDENNATPLCVSSQDGGNLTICKLLIDNGADVNHTTIFMKTPLLVASYHGHVEIVKLFLSKGAYLMTSIRSASQRGHNNVVAVLQKWPVTMFIIMLQELLVYNQLDFGSIVDLFEFSM